MLEGLNAFLPKYTEPMASGEAQQPLSERPEARRQDPEGSPGLPGALAVQGGLRTFTWLGWLQGRRAVLPGSCRCVCGRQRRQNTFLSLPFSFSSPFLTPTPGFSFFSGQMRQDRWLVQCGAGAAPVCGLGPKLVPACPPREQKWPLEVSWDSLQGPSPENQLHPHL